jgi:hypothetical protein
VEGWEAGHLTSGSDEDLPLVLTPLLPEPSGGLV